MHHHHFVHFIAWNENIRNELKNTKVLNFSHLSRIKYIFELFALNIFLFKYVVLSPPPIRAVFFFFFRYTSDHFYGCLNTCVEGIFNHSDIVSVSCSNCSCPEGVSPAGHQRHRLHPRHPHPSNQSGQGGGAEGADQAAGN